MVATGPVVGLVIVRLPAVGGVQLHNVDIVELSTVVGDAVAATDDHLGSRAVGEAHSRRNVLIGDGPDIVESLSGRWSKNGGFWPKSRVRETLFVSTGGA